MRRPNRCKAGHYVLMALILATLLASPARAVLAPSKLSDLIRSSDVIFRGRVIDAELSQTGGGVAKLHVDHIFRGWVGGATVTITWASEPHDQALDRAGEERLFFLRRDQKNG